MSAARSSIHTGVTVAVVAIALSVAACSAGQAPPVTTVPVRPGGISRLGTTVPPVPSATAPPGTGNSPGTATISRFDVPASVRCPAGGTGDVRADYATDGARVQFSVDNRPVEGPSDPAGTFTIQLTCDGSIHTIVLSSFDADGRSTVQSRAVLADDGGG